MIPLENYGIQVMSVGFLLPADDPHKPIIWRGPLLQKALNQLLYDVGASTLPPQNSTDTALNGGHSRLVIEL